MELINNYQLPEGYKKTEVGLIPVDWLCLKIGDLLSFKNGLNKSKTFFGNGTPIVNYMDVFQHPGLYKSDILGKVTVSNDEIRAYGVRKGDVFFTRTSETVEEIGMATVLLENIDNCVFSGFVLRGRPKNSDCDLNLIFKKYCFNSEIVRKQVTSTSSYTTRALTNGKLLSQVILPCPATLPEQEAIAQTLSDVDALIDELDKLIAKKRNIKTGTMQQLLTGKTRLPGFGEGKGYKKSAIGVIPEDWDVINIQTALDEKYIEDQMDGNHGELYPRSHEFVSYGVPYIGANDFLNGQVNLKNCKFLSETRAKQFKKGIARNGDVLFAHNATVGPVAILKFGGDFLILSTTATYFRCNQEKLNNLYFRFVLEAQYFIKQYRAVMAQSTRFQVPITTQRKFLIAVYPIEEQKAIAKVLSDIDTEITALEKRRAKTQAIKQGMMQELLTGRTRLKIEHPDDPITKNSNG
jgi:type I restriction enzyme S subunit